MNDSKLLYDAFNIYYERGINALNECKYELSKKNILLAAETLLKLAKKSEGSLKESRVKRAEELSELASKIDIKIQSQKNVYSEFKNNIDRNEKNEDRDNSNNEYTDENDINIVNNEKISLEEAFQRLNELEGLNEVKQQVSDLVDQIKAFRIRKSQNLPTPEMSHHMVFTGNPGTGKTTVARIIGQIYCALGIISKGHLVEVDRSDLVAGYVGQTALKTKDVISKAKGGVLFIDEAYTLKKDGNDFGQEAIDTLNKEMEDLRTDLIVIVAGYKDEIKTFIDSNQGLKSRFRTYIDFKDYSGKELFNIFVNMVTKNKYILDEKAGDSVKAYLADRSINNFTGNARDVRNLFENVINLQSRRIAHLDSPSRNDIMTILKEDLPFNTLLDDSCDEDADNADNEESLNNEDSSNSNNDFPEEHFIEDDQVDSEYKFDWDSLPSINFEDIAGLENVKNIVRTKVLLPLTNPEVFEGYEKKNGGGLFLYGPPGTGKTMIGAAIANEIGAKFCSVKPSDLLHQGAGNTEKAVKALFSQARKFPCSVIYFDEMDSITQKNTKSSYSRQLRSELLSQIQGIESYGKKNDNVLFLISATNKPWDVDSAFLRPGRFGTKVYVGLPDTEARKYMIESHFRKIKQKAIVSIKEDLNINFIVDKTDGFNCSDITNLLEKIDELSALRSLATGMKYICQEDANQALEEVHSSVQPEDIQKLISWKAQNDA